MQVKWVFQDWILYTDLLIKNIITAKIQQQNSKKESLAQQNMKLKLQQIEKNKQNQQVNLLYQIGITPSYFHQLNLKSKLTM